MSRCPVCQSEADDSFRDRFGIVRKCNYQRCGHLFIQDPAASRGVHEHDSGNPGMFALRNRRLVRRLGSMGLLNPSSSVLDIGAGLGHISAEIQAQFPRTRISCIEAAPESVNALKARRFRVLQDPGHLDSADRFDLILLVEVIEHVEDPVELLRVCQRHLADQGALFLTTPCGELRNGSHATAAYKIPEHIQFFTERSLGLALSKAGFRKFDYLEMREYHAGSDLRALKWIKDSARILRNLLQGRHHFICIARRD